MWSPFKGLALYLDTNVIIYAVEGQNQWSDTLRQLFEEIDARAIHAFTSELTLAEVLTKPLELGATELIATYEEFLAPDSLVRVIPIDRIVLRLAAGISGKMRIKLADAIHLATATHSACDFMLTNDEQLGQRIPTPLQWLSLAQITTSPKVQGK
jgi:predicted nucleic acid-binding protein